ncbi:cysteine desulfurase sulfur acceptor subunit CsdE [Vibrio sp. SS-MA-C1-2]|uniref:cysteine desulfurase sulfur acceptor subunit CsdE n=1 Tax=Vibrio sp. SS-MA-C1-2 TaxID=2908646 RepID=UPI001F375A23|nr:cysteine desulfurase sulfur acceptor subunit CsdE [Vibrio sp. SS-MA-C1-2]UJF18920.1 cysteine desulfurase sulfur acceptor subunit CsdE [Vibrio sp. SS-MA-C1-2]
MSQLFPENPFGTTIDHQAVIAKFAQCQGWEARYREVVMLSKKLPKMPEALKQQQLLISGCESQVWMTHQMMDDKFIFCADSDARIVRGLIAVVMAALNNKTAQQITEFDLDGYFAQLDLINHLSPTRGNGLNAIIQTIKSLVNN